MGGVEAGLSAAWAASRSNNAGKRRATGRMRDIFARGAALILLSKGESLMEWTRRQFAGKVLTGAMGASLATRLIGQQPARKLRYCIVGLGRISMDHFMPATRISKFGTVTALVSGHRDKAERMAAQYGVPAKSIYSYQDYDAIAQNPEIDAVYIALPNSMHAEYSIRAAKAGKHVLCEKPMATSTTDAEAMVEACRTANRKLMIAYRCQFEPLNVRAVELIRSGRLGKVESINTGFGFNIGKGEWRLNRKLAGGGPLMDVGIYSLNACRYLTGEEPVDVKGYSSVIDQDGRFQEVEENLSWSMKFPSGAVASCSTTYGANLTGFFRVFGSRGVISLENAFSYDGQHLFAQIQGEPKIDEASAEKDPFNFYRLVDHMAECVFQNKEPKCAGEEGLRDMKLMAAIYKSC
jgi:predicted dehydrogenase